jgi:peptidoglycan hydrolase-like protein with peptidoglycan-binding domain
LRHLGTERRLRRLGYALRERKKAIAAATIGGAILVARARGRYPGRTQRLVKKVQRAAGIYPSGIRRVPLQSNLLPGRILGWAGLGPLSSRVVDPARWERIKKTPGIPRSASKRQFRDMLMEESAHKKQFETGINEVVRLHKQKKGVLAGLARLQQVTGTTPLRSGKTLSEMHAEVHGPLFKSWRRQVERRVKGARLWKPLAQEAARLKGIPWWRRAVMFSALPSEQYHPRVVRSLNKEMIQHKVPLKTRLQWLSANFNRRYKSEGLFKLATGRTPKKPVYIFPYVKNAPREMNDLLQHTYESARRSGASRQVAAKTAWRVAKQRYEPRTVEREIWRRA